MLVRCSLANSHTMIIMHSGITFVQAVIHIILYNRTIILLQAHRLILAVNSPVFGAMLYGPLALPEGEALKLPEDPPHAFHWILEHIYLRDVKLPDVETALEVYRLASKYQMDALVRVCAQVYHPSTRVLLSM